MNLQKTIRHETWDRIDIITDKLSKQMFEQITTGVSIDVRHKIEREVWTKVQTTVMWFTRNRVLTEVRNKI